MLVFTVTLEDESILATNLPARFLEDRPTIGGPDYMDPDSKGGQVYREHGFVGHSGSNRPYIGFVA